MASPRLFKEPLHNLHQQLEAVVPSNVLEDCQALPEDICRLCALELTTTKLALPGQMPS